MVAVSNVASERWFDILGRLQTPEALTLLAASSAPTQRNVPRQILQKVLTLAITSVQHDDQWNVSGIPELLLRAREMADVGVLSSWRMAVSLLDFHKMVVRAQLAAKGSQDALTSDDTSSSGSDTCESGSVTVHASGLLKRRHPDDVDSSCSDKDSDFAWPEAPRQHQFAMPALPSSPRSQRSLPHAVKQVKPEAGLWSNALCYNHHGRTAVLANLDVPLPISLPNCPLHVSAVVPRSVVKMGKHRACRTSFQRATPAQVDRLHSLAANELVVVAPLSGDAVPLEGARPACGPAMVLVPYLDDAKALRCVTFLLNSSPTVAAPLSPPSKRVAR